jgi:peptidoglycan/LPS O-acetylase OafA/YrhL
MAMYLFLPWLFVFLYPNRLPWRVIAIWLISIVGGVTFLSYIGRPTTEYFTLYIPCFLPGVIAYQLQRKQRLQLPAPLWPGVVIATVLLFLYKQNLLLNDSFKSWIACFLLGLAVPFFAQISARWITTPSYLVAKYSYGIYLTHFFCIWLAFDRLHYILPRVERLALFTTVAIALPIALYHYLEEPMVGLGKLVAKRFDRAATRRAAPAIGIST